jgi:hypothetical protein
LFPAYLLIVPLARRDARCLAGSALALVLGLVVIPVAAMGWRDTAHVYADYTEVLLKPVLGLGQDAQRSRELLNATGTQSQSFQVVLHKTLHFGEQPMPPVPAGWVKKVHLLVGGLLTLAVLWRGGSLHRATGLALVSRVGLLGVLMALCCPVCHLHYFVLLVPVVMALLVKRDLRRPGRLLHPGLVLLSLLLVVALSVPMVPAWNRLRDVGVPMWAVLAFWALGWATRWESGPEASTGLSSKGPPAQAA